jgi:hypothetical protein
MTTIQLTIDTDDRKLAFDLMGNPQRVGSGTSAAVAPGATLTLNGMLMRKALGFPETLELALSFGTGVASGVVANWLYAKLKGRNVRLRIEEMEVDIDEGEIKRIVSRSIERSE